MTPPKGNENFPASESPFEQISLSKLSPEVARQNFHALLLANPNYFGNLIDSPYKAVFKIQGDTAYDSIGCLGYNPQLEQLRATINIKQTGGYSGGVCSNGSQEYVRFYLSYDGGTVWQDQGLTAVNVFDVPGPKPLEYAVTLQISPKEEFCFVQNLPLARAILSWNSPPPANAPNWTPVWGNIVDAQIQIEGFDIILLSTLLADAKVQLPEQYAQAIDLAQPIKAATPMALSAVDLHNLYANLNVPQHRYLGPLLATAATSPALATIPKKPATASSGIKASIAFGGISDINLAALIEAWLNTNGDTTYEQLDCIGLNPNSSQLTGILEVKQSAGYSGGPCSAGSREYVAFWMDWGSGWEYAGTTSVVVHDYSITAPTRLEYNVFLPIDLLSHAKPCYDGPQTARVRAVLSWNTPPSTTNPYAHVVWGNAREALVLIPPGQVIGTGQQLPVLSAVGDVEVSKIGADGRIVDAVTITTGAHFVDAPFGGRITLAGQISNPTAGLKYRVMKAPHGTLAFAPVVNEPGGLTLTINTFSGGVWTQSDQTFHADVDGYYTYQDYSPDHFVEGQVLGVWNTTAADSGYAYNLRVDLYAFPAPDIQSDVVTVQVNNDAPTAILSPTFGECGKLAPGDSITGVFTATASDFGSFGFSILPPGPANGVLPAPPSGASVKLGGAILDPGVVNESFTLNTTGMDPCGYSLTLGVWDRTNVNSGETSNYNQSSVGFCLQTGS
ncbi:MAG TPA: hypothetical protein VGG85_01050 [Terracidiphilus sp.]|jgi:hypothetical protein